MNTCPSCGFYRQITPTGTCALCNNWSQEEYEFWQAYRHTDFSDEYQYEGETG